MRKTISRVALCKIIADVVLSGTFVGTTLPKIISEVI